MNPYQYHNYHFQFPHNPPLQSQCYFSPNIVPFLSHGSDSLVGPQPFSFFQSEQRDTLINNQNKTKIEESNISEDQEWINSFFKRDVITGSDSSLSTTCRVCVSELRSNCRQILNLEEKYKALALQLKLNMNKISDEKWNQGVHELERIENRLYQFISSIDDRRNLERASLKLKKRLRHKDWERRKKMTTLKIRDGQRNRRANLHQQIDEWRRDWLKKDEKRKEEESVKKKLKLQIKNLKAEESQIAEALTRVEKLAKLRQLRRSTLKREGQSDLEEDDRFEREFQEVKSVLESQRQVTFQTVERLQSDLRHKEREAAVEKHFAEKISTGVSCNVNNSCAEQEDKRATDLNTPTVELELDGETLRVDKEMYTFYHQAELDIQCLVTTRRGWDAHIVAPGTLGGSRIPPALIEPVAPANQIWARYIVK